MYEKLNADEIDKMVQNIYYLEESLTNTDFASLAPHREQLAKDLIECLSAYVRYKTVHYLKEAEEKTREIRLV